MSLVWEWGVVGTHQAPVDLTLEDLENHNEAGIRVARVTGGRGDVIGGSYQTVKGSRMVSVVYFPVYPQGDRAVPIDRKSRLVVATRAPDLLAMLNRSASDPAPSVDLNELQPERDFAGVLIPSGDATTEERSQIRRLGSRMANDCLLLREGEPLKMNGAGWRSISGALSLLVWVILGLVKADSEKKQRSEESDAIPARPPAEAASGIEESPENWALAPDPAEPAFPAPSGALPVPVLRAAPVLHSAGPSNPPGEAAAKRRLIDYSAIATVSPAELLRRFRFVADKAILLPEGLRVFPVVGKGFDIPAAEIHQVRAYRCPNITPWHSLLVVEIVPSPSADWRARSPIRLVPRTKLEFPPETGPLPPGAEGQLRAFAQLVAARSPVAAIDADARPYLESGVPPPRFESLRALAAHDAKFPDVG